MTVQKEVRHSTGISYKNM